MAARSAALGPRSFDGLAETSDRGFVLVKKSLPICWYFNRLSQRHFLNCGLPLCSPVFYELFLVKVSRLNIY